VRKWPTFAAAAKGADLQALVRTAQLHVTELHSVAEADCVLSSVVRPDASNYAVLNAVLAEPVQ
jgi:hypothetical protein